LSVTADDARYDRVAEILERNGAVDLDTREAEWRSAGWTGYAGMGPASATTGEGTTNRDAPVNEEGVVQVVEEQLRVGKRRSTRAASASAPTWSRRPSRNRSSSAPSGSSSSAAPSTARPRPTT
jgi:hypothetical protein